MEEVDIGSSDMKAGMVSSTCFYYFFCHLFNFLIIFKAL